MKAEVLEEVKVFFIKQQHRQTVAVRNPFMAE
jgi:hypothetical protein